MAWREVKAEDVKAAAQKGYEHYDKATGIVSRFLGLMNVFLWFFALLGVWQAGEIVWWIVESIISFGV